MQNPVIAGIVFGLIGLIVGIAIPVAVFMLVPSLKKKAASKKAESIIHDAEVEGEKIIKNAKIDAKQAAFEAKQQAQNEIRVMKSESLTEQAKLDAREASIVSREKDINRKEQSLDAKNDNLDKKIEAYEAKSAQLDEKINAILAELEKVAGMSVKEAHDEIMSRVESKMSTEIAQYIKNSQDDAKEQAEAFAKDIISVACDKYAQDVVTERTVAVIPLPSDDLKGRLIGREGRNIRVLEQTLGVDLVIDDTPEVITVSCFDPIRREIARRTIESLVKDGRIQPGRIEEVAAKMKKDLESETQKAGEEAAFKLGLPRINRELLGYVGRLKYRTSYGQNALTHSMEVAYLCGIMAGELKLDVNLARRAGLLHDIGKSVDFEMEGSHVFLGSDLARKYNEPEVVINSIESHHGDVEAKSVIAHLVAAADTLSAARPGARSETMETYIKRITQLEDIAKSYDGVQQAYAMQSGREIRVMVLPEKISDLDAVKLAQDMREKIETTMTYPGQIKISVIREYRAVETAK